MIFRVYCYEFVFIFFQIFFQIFNNMVMNYNTRNRSNYTTETERKKTCFNTHFHYSQLKIPYTSQCRVREQEEELLKLLTLYENHME